MPVIGRADLVKMIQLRTLVVSPILSSEQLGASSIDLRIGNVVLMVRARGSSHVDPKAYKSHSSGSALLSEQDKRQKHERYEIPFGERFLLHPGTLALVPTLEWLKLPADLHGMVTARSTWAREGLSIATASFVEPGYEGIVTLELANLGQVPIALYPGMRVAQIAFNKVQGKTEHPTKEKQFQLSFEPQQGDIAKRDDHPFIP